MSKKSLLVVERSRNDIDNQLLVTSTPLSDRAFWTSSFYFKLKSHSTALGNSLLQNHSRCSPSS